MNITLINCCGIPSRFYYTVHGLCCVYQLANCDHTDTVLRTAFVKYDVIANPDDYAIFQTLPDGSGLFSYTLYRKCREKSERELGGSRWSEQMKPRTENLAPRSSQTVHVPELLITSVSPSEFAWGRKDEQRNVLVWVWSKLNDFHKVAARKKTIYIYILFLPSDLNFGAVWNHCKTILKLSVCNCNRFPVTF